MQAEKLVLEAFKLPEDQQAFIASRLLRGLKAPHHWVSDHEVAERIREAEDDPSVLISYEELLEGIQKSGS